MDRVKSIEDELKVLREDMQEIKELDYNLMNKLSSAMLLIDKRLATIEGQLNLVLAFENQITDKSKGIYSGKDMYEMFKIEGMTHAQIAKRCECSVSTVKRHINDYKNSILAIKLKEDNQNE